MAKRAKVPPDAASLSEALARFGGRDTRGGVIMAAAWLDDSLERCLEKHFSRDPGIAKDLLRSDGPLGNFAVRIKIAYLLGLISEPIRQDLDLIRAIRNDFAHVRERISFTDQRIKDRCDAMNVYRYYSEHSRGSSRGVQNKFVITSYLITAGLIALATKSAPPPDFVQQWVWSLCESVGAGSTEGAETSDF